MRAKHYWIVPLIAALLVAGVGWWADGLIYRVMRQQLTDDLKNTGKADVTALEIWMANQKRIASLLSDEPRLRTLATDLLTRTDSHSPDRRAFQGTSRQLIFGDRLQQRLTNAGYTVAQLVNTNFEVVLDTGREHSRVGSSVGEDIQPHYAELFTSGEAIVITPFKMIAPIVPDRRPGPGEFSRRPDRNSPPPDKDRFSDNRPPPQQTRELTVMQVAAPIKDTNGIVVGALAVGINPDKEFTRILSVARNGESGETFAFDADGIMISRSRFEDQLKELGLIENRREARSELSLRLSDPGGDLSAGYKLPGTNTVRPLIELVSRCISGGSGVEIQPSRDYRGVEVIGAWNWLPTYNFGVVTKIDAHEAFHTLRVVRLVFVALFLLLLLASVMIVLFSYRQVVWRQQLTEARQMGQYKLVEKISEGGMGMVYKAHHALLRRETALKLLRPDQTNALAIQRFEREVRLTCRLTHPNTIQVYDYGHTPDGIFYCAMEYLDGFTLWELIDRYGPLPEGRVIYILSQICGSLAEAHGLGLIHRDIKPSNIFVCDRGGVPDMVKVLDFGLVKDLNLSEEGEADNAEDGEIIGTPSFMSPEAFDNAALSDVHSDLYSLGAVGYFLLTGQTPFDGDTAAELRLRHQTEAPQPPSERLGRPVCQHLEAIIVRCLAKKPEERPQSARELSLLLAAGPHAADWTVELRTAWWKAHREQTSQTHESLQDSSSSRAAMQIEIPENGAE